MAIHIFPGGIRIVCGDGIHHLTVRLNGFLVNPLVIEFAKELYGVCNHRQQLAYHAVLGTAGNAHMQGFVPPEVIFTGMNQSFNFQAKRPQLHNVLGGSLLRGQGGDPRLHIEANIQ